MRQPGRGGRCRPRSLGAGPRSIVGAPASALARSNAHSRRN